MAREWRSTVALALVVGLALVGLTGPERASAEIIESGTTRLELAHALSKTLKAEDVRVTKLGSSQVTGRQVTLRVIGGGIIDVANGEGAIENQGGFRLRAGKRSVKVSRVTLNTSKEVLRANIGGRKFTIATFQGFGFSRAGFADVVEVGGLRLNRQACNLLNRKLGLDAFRPGRAFASIASSIEPDMVQMAAGSFRIDFDASTVAKIRSLGFELRPFESTGDPTEPPSYTGPLIYGSVDPRLTRTSGAAEGGFWIADADGPGPDTFWFNLGISLETGKLLSNSVAHTEFGQLSPAPPAPLAALDLAGASPSFDPATRTVAVSTAKATLEPGVADYLNKTFAEPKGKGAIFAGGDPLGTVSMTIQGR